MAPKQKTAPKAKAKPAPKAKAATGPKAKRPAEVENVLDQAPQKSQRKLERRDTGEKADRAIEHKWKNVSAQKLASTTVNGVTAKEAVMAELRRPGVRRVGPLFMRQLAVEYGFGNCLLNIKPADSELPIGDDLAEALDTCFETDCKLRSVAPLQSVLSQRDGLNSRELAGLFNAPPGFGEAGVSKQSRSQVWVDVLKCVARLQKNDEPEFKRCIAEAFDYLDDALGEVWRHAKRGGTSLRTWLRVHTRALALVCDKADIQAIIATPPDNLWSAKDHIARVCDRLHCGDFFFKEVADKISRESFSTKVQAVIAKLGNGASTIDEFKNVRSQLKDLAKEESARTQGGKKKGQVHFMDYPLDLQAADALQWTDFALKAFVKTRLLLSQADFVRLPFENMVLPVLKKGDECAMKVPDDVLEDMLAARQTAVDICSNAGDNAGFASWRHTLLENSSVLLSLDPTFAVEIQFLEKRGLEWFRSCCQEVILKKLPSDARAVTVKSVVTVVTALSDLQKLPLFRAGTSDVTSDLEVAMELVGGLVRLIPPEVSPDAEASTWPKKVLEASLHFCTHTEGTKTLRGRAAVNAKFGYLTKAMAKKESADKLTCGDYDEIMCYSWCLQEDQRDQLQEQVDKIMAKVTVGAKKKASASKAAASSKDGKGAASSKDSKGAKASCMHFFG